ncbi:MULTISPECIES: TIGR03915 family putative DNA repair protein [unclassified Acinetobacter]|uniref:TIGR03915 family putative DNA repair protein n=1 Tax=unclassified Acinetobacter TaxID=196816 RepID=UPI00244ADFEB|nr:MULTISPECIES: TIGR03915 family putative DNA repair protein [unclassified Acinetobacter]MDH0029783.1 TIGR03915 family putative DNA repair protein [Acinetobacter sp. GD04021]MDH0885453.1 TIGR03915 family putative DNA repair protein [Acinetobacter sp. GD03873]MDH1081571.1 TIGR03915 family putative DNA repair protein [Acinetobacter sp. GD03983]MDH2188648.1 TIGR03915 family putative DNA repair protein [Acinetobacter sp. GD03645]MDH2204002.1 TIGR03915 family putative DNA repair protein [Acinetoba
MWGGGMVYYYFDGSMVGLLNCVFRAFQFREFQVKLCLFENAQHGLFSSIVEIPNHEQYAQRVWSALQRKLSQSALRQFYFAYLSESLEAHQHLLNYCIYVFSQQGSVETDYSHPSVLAISQWTKKVGREKHRMEAFIRFKKTTDGLFLSLVRPDFNVLPLIQPHFRRRYQDQRWLIYDEQRKFGLYYDLHEIHEVSLQADEIDRNLENGFSQSFQLQLDEQEVLYDQLWKDYFNSINIKERQNIRLHVQYLPKRYWRYLNEKLI